MAKLKCESGSCIYHDCGSCFCSNLSMSAKKDGAKCNSYKVKDDKSIWCSRDGEFARDLWAGGISCSAQDCIFNIHFACKAGDVKIDKQKRLCTTYNKI